MKNKIIKLWKWLWFDCPRHGSVYHAGKGYCAICPPPGMRVVSINLREGSVRYG